MKINLNARYLQKIKLMSFKPAETNRELARFHAFLLVKASSSGLSAVSHSLSASLREALRTAVAETMGNGSMSEADLETLRLSLSKMLQTAAPAEVGAVSDIRYRAMIAAQLDAIFSELRLAPRS